LRNENASRGFTTQPSAPDRRASDIVGGVVSDVERFAAGHPADDDTAVLVMKSL